MSTTPEFVEAHEAQRLRGSPVRRREDRPMLTGDAQYTDDIDRANLLHLAFVRSHHAHARIEAIDTSAAEAIDGVVAVYTADDVAASGVTGEVPPVWLLPGLKTPPYPMLARDKVCFQGQPVAAVVAERRYLAADAADAIDVTYDRLDAVVSPSAAVADGAPQLHEEAPNNVAAEWEIGDEAATDAAFDRAAHTVELDLVNQRLLPTAMEPRAVLAEYNASTKKATVHMSTQCPHLHRRFFCEMLDFPEHRMRVVAPDVGGGFGSKDSAHPDEALTIWAALQLKRPVKWIASRTEGYVSTGQGRGHETHAEMALSEAGDILAIRVHTYGDLGGHLSTFGALNPTWGYAPMLPGQYVMEAMHCTVTEAFTNAVPTEPYRGAGRPEASYVIERLVHLAATELGMDPAEFRRRNYIPPDEFPYETVAGYLYDSGDYEPPLDRALELVGYDDLRARQEQLRTEGRYLGIGISSYVESCGYGPSAIVGQIGGQLGLWETGVVRFHPSGKVTVFCGTSGHGQGHQTTYAQIVADELGIDFDDVDVVEGDTDEVPMGMGTYGSRSVTVGGAAVLTSARKAVEKARQIAAHQLEAGVEDVEFASGEFSVTGAPDRSIHIQEVARQAYLAHDLPEGLEPGLEEESFYDPENLVFPFGVHVVVCEIDGETGELSIERYVAVDDCGEQINPKIVEGQIHGAIAQGLGQGRYEGVVYDESGNLVTGSMQDYAIPKASQLPHFETDHTVTPCPHNPLGVKGVGEAGTIAAPQAVVNAVCDALAPLGVDHVDMPVTDEAVWRAMSAARGDAAVTDGGEA